MLSPRILIVGGGIAGLAFATALRRRGFNAELAEREPQWKPAGGGIAVQPNAMCVLHELGVGSTVEGAGARVHRWLFRDWQGELLCDIALKPLWGEVGPFVGIERTKLHDALLAGAATFRLGVSVTALSQEEHRVLVAFSDGIAREYDVVIGADGIHSTVRRLAFVPTQPVFGGQMVWRSLGSLPGPQLDSVQFWLGEGCFFGLCPVGNGFTYGFANVTTPRFDDPLEGRLQRLRRRFAGFGPLVRDYLDSLERDEQGHCAALEWLPDEHWHSGRVILIGDAAHATSPMMGQGGSMAMEDALVLAEILDAAPDVAAAKEAFVARRRPRVAWVRQQSLAVGEMLRLPASVRDPALRERGKNAFCERFGPLTARP